LRNKVISYPRGVFIPVAVLSIKAIMIFETIMLCVVELDFLYVVR